MYIMDLLMGETPWLNDTTSCSFPDPWTDTTKATRKQPKRYRATLPLQKYVGTYGNFGYGNLSVVLENNELRLLYGDYGKWRLHPTEDDNVFFGTAFGLMWGLDLSKVEFGSFDTDSIHTVTIPDFNGRFPPVFSRGLLMSQEPLVPYEDPCTPDNIADTSASVKHTAFMGMQLFMFIFMSIINLNMVLIL